MTGPERSLVTVGRSLTAVNGFPPPRKRGVFPKPFSWVPVCTEELEEAEREGECCLLPGRTLLLGKSL